MPARLKWLRSIVVRLPAGNITTRLIAKGIFGCGALGVSRCFGAGFFIKYRPGFRRKLFDQLTRRQFTHQRRGPTRPKWREAGMPSSVGNCKRADEAPLQRNSKFHDLPF